MRRTLSELSRHVGIAAASCVVALGLMVVIRPSPHAHDAALGVTTLPDEASAAATNTLEMGAINQRTLFTPGPRVRITDEATNETFEEAVDGTSCAG